MIKVNDIEFVFKTKYKFKEVKTIEDFWMKYDGSDEMKKQLILLLCEPVTGKLEDVNIDDMYEDDFYKIQESYFTYKKKLTEFMN